MSETKIGKKTFVFLNKLDHEPLKRIPVPESLLRMQQIGEEIEAEKRLAAEQASLAPTFAGIRLAQADRDSIGLRARKHSNWPAIAVGLAVAAAIVGFFVLPLVRRPAPGPPLQAGDPKKPPVVPLPETVHPVPPVIVTEKKSEPRPKVVPQYIVQAREKERKAIEGEKNELEKLAATLPKGEWQARLALFEERYRKFTEQYPGSVIKDVARFLAKPLLEEIVNVPEPPPDSPTPLKEQIKKSDGPATLNTLLAAIRAYPNPKDEPYPIRARNFRNLREQVITYQKEHPKEANPELKAFVTASALTAANERKYAQFRAKKLEAMAEELKGESPESPGARGLRDDILALRATASDDVVSRSKPLLTFLARTHVSESSQDGADLKVQARAMDENYGDIIRAIPGGGRKIRLLCLLPPAVRKRGNDLYTEIQKFANDPRNQPLDPDLMNFLLYTRRSTDQLAMMLLVYVYPDPGKAESVEFWNRVFALGGPDVEIIVILDPGIGTARQDRNYAQLIRDLRARNITVLGFVDAGEGNRPLNDVASEVKKWVELYGVYPANSEEFWAPIDGIYFAHQATGRDKVDYFAELFRRARSVNPKWGIVSSPGAPCDEGYLSVARADKLCLMIGRDMPPVNAWEAKYSPSRFSAFIHPVRPQELDDYIIKAVERHLGCIYISNHEDHRAVPDLAYLAEEFNFLLRINRLIAFGVDPAQPFIRTRSPAPKRKARN